MTRAEWTKCLDEALERSIRSYPQWNKRDDMWRIPNYNPKLLLRQVGYPMVLPPSEEAVTPFFIHGIRTQNGEVLKKI
ncbi:hypothetical protein CR513_16992, partial [Mucuna pruriens]